MAVLIASLAIAAVAVPIATGGPSALTIAKKALRVGKQAKRAANTAGGTASQAIKRANSARGTASEALNRATQALNQRVTLRRVEGPVDEQTGNAGGGDAVGSSFAACPTGSLAVGGGFETPTTRNHVGFAVLGVASYAAIAVNEGSDPSSVQATVTCASGPVALATTSAASRASAKRRFEAKAAEMRTALHQQTGEGR